MAAASPFVPPPKRVGGEQGEAAAIAPTREEAVPVQNVGGPFQGVVF